jgi:NAD-dependent SIR2 family protein deacetylase
VSATEQDALERDDDGYPVFECEGLFTHWVCPGCGWNDYSEGDIRGERLTCSDCGLEGCVSS